MNQKKNMRPRYGDPVDVCHQYGINGLCGPDCPEYGKEGRPCKDEEDRNNEGT
jgi:hypothetical protein